MERGRTKRGYPFDYAEKEHLKLKDLKSKAIGLSNEYLYINIPTYPQPEFHVSHLKHDTDRKGLEGIHRDNGFKVRDGHSGDPDLGRLLWWSLSVGPDEISAAETRLLEKTYPDRTVEQVQMQQSFLEKFATSPAFSQTSRLGAYRFTFPVEELLKAYSEQFCSGAQPIMRVLRTDLYKQEVMYAVLVHSPANQQLFSDFPLLPDDLNAVCSFRDGCFTWRSQAMCGTHDYRLVQRPEEKQMETEGVSNNLRYYVWDHVAIALHVEEQVLKFDGDRLRENLKFCRADSVTITPISQCDKFPQAEDVVKELWPDHPSPLEEA